MHVFVLLLVVVVPAVHPQATVDELQCLFDRPLEPVYEPKQSAQSNKKVVFDVPDEYLTPRQRQLSKGTINRFSDEASSHFRVKNIRLPDMSYLKKLDKRAPFSHFIPEHKKMAATLVSIFMNMQSLDDLVAAATYARNNLNTQMYLYAYSVALLHRDDTKTARIPNICTLLPDKFMDGSMLGQIREETQTSTPQERVPLVVPKDNTASDLEEEHKVAYFREDLGVNLHHWHWHLAYPGVGEKRILDKDRRGELFYYMHEQIIARYNFERFSNHLKQVQRLNSLRENIPEGYFPKLSTLVASKLYPPRASNSRLYDMNRDGNKVDLSTLERWRDRIDDAITSNAVKDTKGATISLANEKGIDILGNIVEPSDLSPDKNFYGGLHGAGHDVIAHCHDPDNRHLESFGVMGDVSTAMRDPVFYRWHSYMDDIFQNHKRSLPPYATQELNFPGVRVMSVSLQTRSAKRKDELFTYWQQSDVNMDMGFDFTARGAVFARYTHLQHRPFSYSIQIENSQSQPRQGFVRIFMAPKLNEKGQRMTFSEKRLAMIEMDRFPTTLRPGSNKVERSSMDSTVTIPYETTFRSLKTIPRNTTENAEGRAQFQFNGCGWPHHMLVPKGTPEGMQAELFVMVTDYDKDKVNSPFDYKGKNAIAYCGVHRQLYPDKRPMGFPFDREARRGVSNLDDFLTANMQTTDMLIHFQDTLEAPSRSPASG